MENGNAGLIGLLGLLGSAKTGERGERGLKGDPGPPGAPGLTLLEVRQIQLDCPANGSPVPNGTINVTYPAQSVPPGTTHICATIMDQATPGGSLVVECISNGVMFLPLSGNTFQPQVTWVWRGMAPVAAGDVVAVGGIAFLKVG